MTYDELIQEVESLGDESDTHDYKQDVNDKCEMAKDLACFSNHKGGTLYLGFDNNGKPIGLNSFPLSDWQNSDEEKIANGIPRKLKNCLSEPLAVKVFKVSYENKYYLKISIEAATKLIGFKSHPDKSYEFWRRVGLQNLPLEMESIREKILQERYLIDRKETEVALCQMLSRHLSFLLNWVREHTEIEIFNLDELTFDEKFTALLNKNLLHNVSFQANKLLPKIQSLTFLGFNIDITLKKECLSIVHVLEQMTGSASMWNHSVQDQNVTQKIIDAYIQKQKGLIYWRYEHIRDLHASFIRLNKHLKASIQKNRRN